MARDVIVELNYDSGVRTTAMGPARMFATVFGIAYLLVAALEVYLNYVNQSLVIDGVTILSFTLVHNIVHWLTGLLLLAAGLAAEWNSKGIVRAVGVLFTLVAIFGFIAPATVGALFGYSGSIPMAYNWIHLGTGVLALVAGFMNPTTGRTRRVHRM